MSVKVASLIAEIGANTTGFTKGASTVKGGLASMASQFASVLPQGVAQFLSLSGAITAVGVAVSDALKDQIEYANQVRQLSTLSGESAEETSRFVQVLDDYKISSQDALAATRALTNEGHTPSIETLARLSDEYLSITDAQQRNEFVIKNLGRNGLAWVEVLNKGSAALLKQGDAVAKNLILTQKMVDDARKAEIATDAWNDSVTGLKTTFATGFLPVLTRFVEGINEGNRAAEIMVEQGLNPANKASQEYRDALKQAHEEQVATTQSMIENAESTDVNTRSAEENAAALKLISEANASLIDGAIDITNRNKDFAESQQDILDNIKLTREEGEELYPWEAEKIEENKAKLDELGQSYFDNLEDFKAAMQEKFTLYAVEQIAMSDGVEGFSEAEYEKARVILETTDVATAAAFEEQQAMANLAVAVSDGTIPVENWGAILEGVMADGVVSVSEVQAAIEAVPKENTITFTIQTFGAPPNLDTTDFSAPVGTHRNGHATGGMFGIPESYGNEGFMLGNGDTASGGEQLQIIPRGQKSGGVTVNIMLDSATPDPERVAYNLAPYIKRVLRQEGIQ